MEHEAAADQEPEHEGEKYLRMIGLGHMAGKTIIRKDGTPMVIRDFLEDERCAKFARPAFIGLESMDPNDSQYRDAVRGIREAIGALVGLDLKET